MLYLAIDQHARQLTVNLRDEAGDVLLRRQVSTRWERVREFFAWLSRRAEGEGGLMAIVEVCGFNDWLLAMLGQYGCTEIVLVQPEKRSRKKTDYRDANQLGELLWTNRQRLLAGKPVQNIRRVRPPTARDAEDRQLTALRRRIGQLRTRTLNKVQGILRRHNLQQDCPTKTLKTKKARRWLGELALGEIDRLEMDQLLAQWDLWQQQLDQLEEKIRRRQQASDEAIILATIPGAAAYASLALSSRVGEIERFFRGASLANYWGITPGVRNSGEVTDRLGSITKQGSTMARFILGQLVMHVLRHDPVMKAWYQRIKRRRGSKIARVAVMRRLACIIWQMLKHRQPYQVGGPPRKRLVTAGG